MDAYGSAHAFRAAIEDRLKGHAAADQVQLDKLRRMVVFERMLARLEADVPGRWIVKGGTALEIRMPGRARRTRDLDMATREYHRDGDHVKDDLERALARDPFGDWFEFRVTDPRPLEGEDEGGESGWRYGIHCLLDGRTFARVRVDVVSRSEEIAATSRARIEGLLDFAGLPPVEVEIVDRRQHFAEKLHAYTRTYGDRPNSRVRDLVDMVLLIEDGLQPDVGLFDVVQHLFRVRGTHEMSLDLPDPPAGWAGSYEGLAAEVAVGPKSLADAVTYVRTHWANTVAATRA